MEDLNRNQIVLLTLLISFVTSIATGIITTSLLQQAPVEVTRTINNVVEKTIQSVAPSVISNNTGPKEVTTVVVKEEDLVLSSIDKNVKSIVRIREKDGSSGNVTFYGIGLVINKDGTISADRKTIINVDTYMGTMSDGTELVLVPTGLDKQTNFILFKATPPSKSTYTFVPATFSDSDPLLGQTLIGLGGETTNSVSVGRVVSLETKDVTVGTTTTKTLVGINTDVSSKDIVDGSPIFNLSGDVVGIELTSDTSKSFTPVSVLKKELSVLVEVPTSTATKTP